MGFDAYTDLAPFNNLTGNLAAVLWDQNYRRVLLSPNSKPPKIS